MYESIGSGSYQDDHRRGRSSLSQFGPVLQGRAQSDSGEYGERCQVREGVMCHHGINLKHHD